MPVESHPVFKSTPGWQRIWRYMSFSRLIWLLETEELHFHRIGDFSNHFEETTPKAIKESREKSIESSSDENNIDPDLLKEAWEKSANTTEQTVFANSWHSKKHESAAMWELYGGSNETIAIVSTVTNLEKALGEVTRRLHLGSVKYVDFYSSWLELSQADKAALTELYHRSESMNIISSALLKRKESTMKMN